MKVLAINCFREDDSTSGTKLMNYFIEGVISAGAEVKTVTMKDLEIKKCRKCTEDPLFKPPHNNCYQEDDMNELYQSFDDSDIWLFGVSYCLSSKNDCIVNFMDRLEPLVRINENIDSDSDFEGNKPKGKIVLLSTCSFWDVETFNPMIEDFKDLSMQHLKEYAGELLRPGATSLDRLNGTTNVQEIFNAAKNAGIELITTGSIPEN